ncbi:MAG: HAMP domain-containing histidine kinase, partial [Caldilineaceae bacterium]|nr:HAMP domain-containing histidine kinase [Caldilineaceae bacterium]
ESQQQVGKLGRITSSLLDLSRLEGGLGDLQRQPEDMRALVQRAAALFRLAAQEKQIALHVTLPASPLITTCDGERIESVLTNLLDNALRFAPMGGHVEIGAAAAADRRSIRLWVQDNGPGVAPADAPFIFERFYQASAAPASAKGAGLGLAIVQSIVRSHGGLVWLETPQTGGSRFVAEFTI